MSATPVTYAIGFSEEPPAHSKKTGEVANDFAIECTGLTKRFGDFTAVDSIDLQVRKGEIFGFLGPNGAGKTTTIKMLTTLLTPNAGMAKVASFDLKEGAAFVRSRIGVVPQEFALFGELTPMENLGYIGELFGMKRDEIRKRSEELLRIVNLHDKKDLPAEGFSGGMKQRLSVATSLLHEPQILFMDEPTSGLDPQSRLALRELTLKLNRSGITIIYTTHDMEEADKLCHTIAIMDHGRIIAQGTSDELKSKYSHGHRIELDFEGNSPGLAAELKRLLGATSVEAQDGKIVMRVPAIGGDVVGSLTHFLSQRRLRVKELKISEPSLEEVFINLTKKDLRE